MKADEEIGQCCHCVSQAIPVSCPPHRLSFRIKHFSQHSRLQLVNSTGADTGEYSCWAQHCQDAQCSEGEDRQGKTFIFFTGTLESGAGKVFPT